MLVQAGLIDREQRGRWAYYRLRPDLWAALAGLPIRSNEPAG
ncbi:hypothetical protein [Mycolicibacillus trivialis]